MFHGFDQVEKAIIIIHQIPGSQGFVGSRNNRHHWKKARKGDHNHTKFLQGRLKIKNVIELHICLKQLSVASFHN